MAQQDSVIVAVVVVAVVVVVVVVVVVAVVVVVVVVDGCPGCANSQTKKAESFNSAEQKLNYHTSNINNLNPLVHFYCK